MSQEEWNSLKRIVRLIFPLVGPGKTGRIVKQKVPDKEFFYDINISKKMPSFTYLPLTYEVFHRLVLRAALATDLSEFKLSLSNC